MPPGNDLSKGREVDAILSVISHGAVPSLLDVKRLDGKLIDIIKLNSSSLFGVNTSVRMLKGGLEEHLDGEVKAALEGGLVQNDVVEVSIGSVACHEHELGREVRRLFSHESGHID